MRSTVRCGLANNLIAESDAFITDCDHVGTTYQPPNLLLVLPAEGTLTESPVG
jgi:hypothetical protein